LVKIAAQIGLLADLLLTLGALGGGAAAAQPGHGVRLDDVLEELLLQPPHLGLVLPLGLLQASRQQTARHGALQYNETITNK
jgi:hypothetical protein